MNTNNILSDFSKSLEEIREMIRILGQDCKDHYEITQANDSQTHRRAYVRSVFSFIEGVLHRTKVATVQLGTLLGSISIHELVVLEGTQLELNDKGEVIYKSLYPTFLNNIKFTFRTFSKSVGSSFNLNLSGQGWQKLRASIKVRDRLMYPKEIIDLQISDAEIQGAKEAFDWFLITHTLSGHYAQKAMQARISASIKDIATLDEAIQRLEAELATRGS